MDHITSNLAGTVRRATVGGREYLVAPLSLIVPGVLNGSRGPLLYPEEEVRRDVSIWNGMPLTRGHPTRNGQPVSARTPDVLQEFGLGTVYNARYDEKAKRLVAEGWFDVANTQRIDPSLLAAVQKGDKIELSTGLFLDVAEEGGVHNGRQYTHVSRNYRADHVAVLVNETGACSKQDGCGVNVNRDFSAEEREKLASEGKALPDGSYPIANESDLHNAIQAFGRAKDKSAVKAHIIKRAKALGLTSALPEGWTTNSTENEMTRDEAIAYLTANCSCQKETLNKMSDDEVSKMCADHKATMNQLKEKDAALLTANSRIKELETQVTTNANPTPPLATPKTADEWYATAPPEIQDAVRNAVEIVNREAKELIEKITAPIANAEQKQAKAAWLSKKGLEELREIASLIPASTPVPAVVFPRPQFYGAGPPATTPAVNTSKPEDVLVLPTVNWDEHSLYPAGKQVAQS
jgi:hypothetical protein